MPISLYKAERLSIYCFLVYGGLIAWLSLSPGSGLPQSIPHSDKLAHFLAYLGYALLSILWLKTFCLARRLLLGLFIFGVLIECAQSFIPLRQMSVLDVIANTTGAMFGTVLAYRLHNWARGLFIRSLD